MRWIKCGGLLPLVVMLIVIFFRSKWKEELVIMFGERPFNGYLLLFAGLSVTMLIYRFVKGSSHLQVRSCFYVIAAFSICAIMGGCINSSTEKGLVSSVQVIIYIVLPFVLAFLVVDSLPRECQGYDNLVESYIFACGIILPLFMIIMSLKSDLMKGLLGWQETKMMLAYGFGYASTSVGSGIGSGLLASYAYCFAICKFRGSGKAFYLIPIGMTSLAMLFSLSRTVLLFMIIFNCLFWGRTVVIRRKRTIAFLLFCLALTFGTGIYVFGKYSFNRFLLLHDYSARVRLSGSRAAWKASLRAPFLGHGPGLLYEDARMGFVSSKWEVPESMILVENEYSPIEPHNTYAYLAAEHGYIGLFLFIVILAVFWRRTQRIGKRAGFTVEKKLTMEMFNSFWIGNLIISYFHSMYLNNVKFSFFFWVIAFSGLHWRRFLAEALNVSKVRNSEGVSWVKSPERRARKPTKVFGLARPNHVQDSTI